METAAGAIGFLLLLSLGVLLYFLPAIIAINRGHPNIPAIFVLNLLLGWTLLGWVIALIWSVMAIAQGPPGSAVPAMIPSPTSSVALPEIASRRGRALEWIAGTTLLGAILTVVILSLTVFRLPRAPFETAPVPPFSMTYQQGVAFVVVVTPEVAASQRDLWVIAEEIRERYKPKAGSAQIMFWTSRTTAAERLPMSELATITQVAQINLNPVMGLRELVALNGQQFTR